MNDRQPVERVNQLNFTSRYGRKLPILPLNLTEEDKNFQVELNGFSGDAIRTCIYYNLKDKDADYHVSDAFMVDDRDRIYSLIAVERAGQGSLSSWMEFGPISPDAKQVELHVTSLQQAPAPKFNIKGRRYIDPWDPEIYFSREMIDKMDHWLGGEKENGESNKWGICGSWNFTIALGNWEIEKCDRIERLNYRFSLGKEEIFFREFRNSNTGAFVVYESRNTILQQLGDRLKTLLVEKFNQSSSLGEFTKKMAEAGIDPGYSPLNLTLRLRDPENRILYSPDFVSTWGIVGNRIYYFFDDCIDADRLDLMVGEIKNLKIDPPLKLNLDIRRFSQEGDICFEIDHQAGDIDIKGKINFTDKFQIEDTIKLFYRTLPGGNLKSLNLNDVEIVVNGDSQPEKYPSLGSSTHYDPELEKLIKLVTFPLPDVMEEKSVPGFQLEINSVDVKLKKPFVYSFSTTALQNIASDRE